MVVELPASTATQTAQITETLLRLCDCGVSFSKASRWYMRKLLQIFTTGRARTLQNVPVSRSHVLNLHWHHRVAGIHFCHATDVVGTKRATCRVKILRQAVTTSSFTTATTNINGGGGGNLQQCHVAESHATTSLDPPPETDEPHALKRKCCVRLVANSGSLASPLPEQRDRSLMTRRREQRRGGGGGAG